LVRFITSSDANYGKHKDKVIDELYQKQARAVDIEDRKKIIRQLEKRLLDEEAHIVWTLQWNRIIPHNSKVHGWTITPSHYLNNMLDTVGLSGEGGAQRARAGRSAARARSHTMWKYLVKRFLLMFPTLVGVAIVTFILIRGIPGGAGGLRL